MQIWLTAGSAAEGAAPAPGPAPPRISVVVPHYNDQAALAGCLAALGAQQAAAPFEVIVVDNGSHEPPEALAAAAGARLVLEPTPGPGPARNAGARAARGPILAFVDADCPPEPGWIAAVAGAFADPAVTVIGGDVRIAPEDPARLTTIEAYESVFGYRFELYIRRDRYAGTGNLAMRRGVFEAVGPFAGIDFAEDMEWGQRASAKGFSPAYVPAMRVTTPARKSFAELARKWDRHVAHFWEKNRQRRLARLRWLALTAATAASPLAEVGTIWRSDRLTRGADRWRALRGVTRIRLWRARRMLGLALGRDPRLLAGGWRDLPGPAARAGR